jgi:mannose-6-phosphate isomerase class I
MGTHPSNPSKDLQTQRTLLDLFEDNESLMSKEISEKYQKKLPFLFKVLSVNKALSIQAHPNKKLAAKLHEKDPKNYPDDNHKPEMALAITPFDGLCGFRPLAEISHFLDTVPSLKSLVGEDEANKFQETVKGQETSEDKAPENKKALQAAFRGLMKSKPEEVEKHAKDLIQQAKDEGEKFAGNGGPSNNGKELSDLMLRLQGQFPNDIGLFVTFFLNYVKLEVGEAMFLQADDIHAYLSGGIFLFLPPSTAHTDMTQTSSSAWLPRTTSYAPASPQSSRTSTTSPTCSPTPTPPSANKRCPRPTTRTSPSTRQHTVQVPQPPCTILRSKNSASSRPISTNLVPKQHSNASMAPASSFAQRAPVRSVLDPKRRSSRRDMYTSLALLRRAYLKALETSLWSLSRLSAS